MMKLKLGYFAFCLALVTACDELDPINEICDENTMCTAEFRFISAENKLGKVPDSVHTVNVENKAIYRFDPNVYGYENRFVVVTDAQMEDLSFEGTPLELILYFGETEKRMFSYVVGKDCCHISLVNGPTVLE